MDDDPVDSLLIDVRANTHVFAQDVAAMRAVFDGTLVEGFSRAGGVLERGLVSAARRGSIGFEDLRRVALGVVNDIAAHAVQGLFAGSGGLVGGVLSSALGLPGRATGGPVSPGRGYIVGERGPELFVPASAGRIETEGRARDVRIAIAVGGAGSPASAPQALQRSARQVASAVRRALSN